MLIIYFFFQYNWKKKSTKIGFIEREEAVKTVVICSNVLLDESDERQL